MNIGQIAALPPPASQDAEFKETIGTYREAAVTVDAFLNQGGGQCLWK